MTQKETILSKPEIQFWIPIIVTVVSITVWGMTLKSDISLLSQQVATNRKDFDTQTSLGSIFVKDFRQLEQQVSVINNILGIN